MANISKYTLIHDCADAYRTASGTTDAVKAGELAQKISELSLANNMRKTVLITTSSDMTLKEVLAAVEYKCYYKNGFIGVVFEGDNPSESSRTYSFAAFANWHTGTNTYVKDRAPLGTVEVYKSGNVSANTVWASGTQQYAHYLFVIEANTGRVAFDVSTTVGGTGTTVTLYEFPIYWDINNHRFVEDLTKWGE